MELVIVSGMSGAGKTVALKAMEDMGFYCIDNLPIVLIDKFTDIVIEAGGKYKKVAIGVDVRSGEDLPHLREVLAGVDAAGVRYQVLYIDASDKVLLKRFKETRRKHPLSPDGRIEDGIKKEREALSWLREKAKYVIDTSKLLTRDLKEQLRQIYAEQRIYKNLYVTVMSFGFKYGIPEDADLLFDVRFLPNPFYEEDLKEKTGISEEVRSYVMQGGDGSAFLAKLYDLMDFLIPRYISEGKNQLIVAMGCTGGKHRSVTMAEALYRHLSERAEYGIKVEHRDIRRNS